MDKHLLADNPMRLEHGGLAIIRTVKPIAIFEVINGHVTTGREIIHRNYENEDYTISLYHLFAEEILSREEVSSDYAKKYMIDAWCWFEAYLKWEDSQMEDL